MECKENLSCTFLDLFLFILNSIDNPTILQDFYYEKNITPNVVLKIEQQTDTDNQYELSFIQQQRNYGRDKKSCEITYEY